MDTANNGVKTVGGWVEGTGVGEQWRTSLIVSTITNAAPKVSVRHGGSEVYKVFF